jgi:hypothetical protein
MKTSGGDSRSVMADSAAQTRRDRIEGREAPACGSLGTRSEGGRAGSRCFAQGTTSAKRWHRRTWPRRHPDRRDFDTWTATFLEGTATPAPAFPGHCTPRLDAGSPGRARIVPVDATNHRALDGRSRFAGAPIDCHRGISAHELRAEGEGAAARP